MERLFEIQRIIIEQLENDPYFWRSQFDQFIAVRQIGGILGPRGIGKTTFLLIPKLAQKLADRRVQSVKNRLLQMG